MGQTKTRPSCKSEIAILYNIRRPWLFAQKKFVWKKNLFVSSCTTGENVKVQTMAPTLWSNVLPEHDSNYQPAKFPINHDTTKLILSHFAIIARFRAAPQRIVGEKWTSLVAAEVGTVGLS